MVHTSYTFKFQFRLKIIFLPFCTDIADIRKNDTPALLYVTSMFSGISLFSAWLRLINSFPLIFCISAHPGCNLIKQQKFSGRHNNVAKNSLFLAEKAVRIYISHFGSDSSECNVDSGLLSQIASS